MKTEGKGGERKAGIRARKNWEFWESKLQHLTRLFEEKKREIGSGCKEKRSLAEEKEEDEEDDWQ